MRFLVRVIPTLCAILVAAASFALSYVALRDVAARTAAVPEGMAWLTPICVDGAVLAGSASLWASSMRGTKKDPVAFLTVVSLLIVSVVINVNHAGPAPLAKVIAALPPLTLLACLELVAGQYRRDASKDETTNSEVPTQEAATQSATAPTASSNPATAPTGPTPAWPTALAQSPAQEPTAPTASASVAASKATATATAPTVLQASSPTPVSTTATSRVAAERSATTTAAASVVSRPTTPTGSVPRPMTPAGDDDTIETVSSVTPLRVRATAPDEAAPTKAAPPARARAGEETSGATRIKELFQAHLDAGGSATDPTLARRFAAELDLQQAYVRKVLGPLRRELEPAI